jgi:hypothetical protein
MAGAVAVIGALIGAASSIHAGRQAKEAKKDAAELARREGEAAAAKQARETAQLLSKQQAAYAASGVGLEGTPLFVIEETERLAAEERELILELSGYRSAALSEEGRAASLQGLGKGTSTLLTGTGRWLENR